VVVDVLVDVLVEVVGALADAVVEALAPRRTRSPRAGSRFPTIRPTLDGCHANTPESLHVFPGAGLAALDMVSRTRLSSGLVVRYMTLCSYIEQMPISKLPFTVLR
jgi:hypothetical protein